MARPKGSPNRNRQKIDIGTKKKSIILRVTEKQYELIKDLASRDRLNVSLFILESIAYHSRFTYLNPPLNEKEVESLEILQLDYNIY